MSSSKHRGTEISLLRSISLNSDKTPGVNSMVIQITITYRAATRHFDIQRSSILAIFLMLFPPVVTASFLHRWVYLQPHFPDNSNSSIKGNS